MQNALQKSEHREACPLEKIITDADIAKIPNKLLSTYFKGSSLEITNYIPDASSLTFSDHLIFFDKALFGYHELASCRPSHTEWHELFNDSIISIIRREAPLFEFIDTKLSDKRYLRTGIHGDLNHNNVVKDSKDYFWIIDWESQSANGSFFWDLCFYYGNVFRNTSRAGKDISSILASSNIEEQMLGETLLFYSLMKFRSDLLRHNRSPEHAFEGLKARVQTLKYSG